MGGLATALTLPQFPHVQNEHVRGNAARLVTEGEAGRSRADGAAGGGSVHFDVTQPRAGASGPLWQRLGLSPVWRSTFFSIKPGQACLPAMGATRALSAEWGYPGHGILPSGLECAPGIETNSFLGPGTPSRV